MSRLVQPTSPITRALVGPSQRLQEVLRELGKRMPEVGELMRRHDAALGAAQREAEHLAGIIEQRLRQVESAANDVVNQTGGVVPLSDSEPQDVGAAPAVGAETASSRGDHVHQGVRSVAKTSEAQGDITFSGAGVVQAGNDFAIAGGITDHGALTGLGDDDHPQYLHLPGRGGQTVLEDGVTAGTGVEVSADALTTGKGLRVSSSSTAASSAKTAEVEHAATIAASMRLEGNSLRVARALVSNFANTVIFSENFNGHANGTIISTIVPDVGTSFTRIYQSAGVDLNVQSNACRPTLTADSSGVFYTFDASYPSPNYEVAQTGAYQGGTGKWTQVAVRIQDVNNLYLFQYVGFSSAGGQGQLWKRTAGAWTRLGTTLNIAPPTTTNVIRFRAVNNEAGSAVTLTVLYDNFVHAQVVDGSSPHIAAGKGGFGVGNIQDSGGDSSTSQGLDTVVVTLLDHYIDGAVAEFSSANSAAVGVWADQAPVVRINQDNVAAQGTTLEINHKGAGNAFAVYPHDSKDNASYVIAGNGFMGIGEAQPGSPVTVLGDVVIGDGAIVASGTGVNPDAQIVFDIYSAEHVQLMTRLYNNKYGKGLALMVDNVGGRIWNRPGSDTAGSLQLGTGVSVFVPRMSIDAQNGHVTFNVNNSDSDFTVRGDTATNLLFVDASLEAFQVGTTVAGAIADFRATGVVLNETGADQDLRVEGDTDANLFVVDASADAIGIGVAAPLAWLHHKASTTAKASERLPTGTAPTTPAEGDRWNDSTQKATVEFIDGIKQHRPGSLFASTADATVQFSAAEGTVVGTGVGTLTLPANFFVAGKSIRVQAGGIHGAVGGDAQTRRVRVKLGATTILDSGANIAVAAAVVSARGWFLDAVITCRTAGAGGTVQGRGVIVFWDDTSFQAYQLGTGAAVSFDTTGTAAVDVTVQFSNASINNLMTGTTFLLEAGM